MSKHCSFKASGLPLCVLLRCPLNCSVQRRLRSTQLCILRTLYLAGPVHCVLRLVLPSLRARSRRLRLLGMSKLPDPCYMRSRKTGHAAAARPSLDSRGIAVRRLAIPCRDRRRFVCMFTDFFACSPLMYWPHVWRGSLACSKINGVQRCCHSCVCPYSGVVHISVHSACALKQKICRVGCPPGPGATTLLRGVRRRARCQVLPLQVGDSV